MWIHIYKSKETGNKTEKAYESQTDCLSCIECIPFFFSQQKKNNEISCF